MAKRAFKKRLVKFKKKCDRKCARSKNRSRCIHECFDQKLDSALRGQHWARCRGERSYTAKLRCVRRLIQASRPVNIEFVRG